MLAYILICRQQIRFTMSGLRNDDPVKRIARPVEFQCRADNGGKGLFAGFKPDVAAQTFQDSESGTVNAGNFMQVG